MLDRTSALVLIVASCLTICSAVARADNKADAALLKALDATRVTLGDGLRASESVGEPISAKFEMEDGHLQLSVYTKSAEGYREALISLSTGGLMSAEKLSDADDLAAARAQDQAMRPAKVSLRAATEKAVPGDGSRGVSVTPELGGGKPVARVTLLRAGKLTTVDEELE